MMKNELCDRCGLKCDIPCAAYSELQRFYELQRLAEKREIIQELRNLLQIEDCETADDLKELAEQIIEKVEEVHYIAQYPIRIGFVRSYEAKQKKGRDVLADCRKVNKTYGAYLPYDFVITFYEPNVAIMTENQIKLIMLHELKHAGLGDRGLMLKPHDIEDFDSILTGYGLHWNEFGTDVPDILAGEENGKGTKRHKKLAAKR